MLATFIHTAGLTGAEVGIAAGTAFLNQKLLGALFGEAAMVELVARARDRLRAGARRDVRRGAGPLRTAGSAPDQLEALAGELRAAAHDLRALSKHGVDGLVSLADGGAVSRGDAAASRGNRQQPTHTG